MKQHEHHKEMDHSKMDHSGHGEMGTCEFYGDLINFTY